MRRVVLGIACAAAMSSCGTSYHRFEFVPFSGMMGYEDFPVTGVQMGRHYISFTANPYTSETTVLAHWNRRAAELCPDGYKVESIKCRCTDSIFFRKRAEGYARCGFAPKDEPPQAGPDTTPSKKLRTTGDIYKGED